MTLVKILCIRIDYKFKTKTPNVLRKIKLTNTVISVATFWKINSDIPSRFWLYFHPKMPYTVVFGLIFSLILYIHCFSFQRVTQSHVLSYLNKLCKRKATGLDSVSARLLRECPDLISGSLALIFNQSIDTGIFPDEWKNARITPLFKKAGSRSDPSNYRPISIIPVVAKVFERIIYDQLYHYLNENNLLSRHQSGFRSLHSTVVHIDENLTWECHINELSKKIASGISAIKRIRYSVPYKTLLSIYNSLVQPHLDYCSSVWGSCSKSLSQKLQKLQNRAARVITFSNYDRNTDELLRMVNWVKLDRKSIINQ